MAIRKEFITSIIAMLVLLVFLGLVYPLVVTGVSQVAFPGNANGQKVYVGGKFVGSKIIGQNFQMPVYKNGKPEMSDGEPVTTPDPRYFQGRPSGTEPAYNAEFSSFANYGPNSKITEKAIASNIAAYIQLTASTTQAGSPRPRPRSMQLTPRRPASIRTSRWPMPGSRPTGSPPCGTCRSGPCTP